mgnify:CR=1 FL=1
MNIKKNCGIVLIVLGIILTLDRTNEFKGIVSFCGVSLLATPQKTKKKWNKKYWFYIAKWIETR